MAQLFKGYILSDGKRPISSIKNGDYLATPPDVSDYVGVLKDEYIQLDFDDEDSSTTILKVVDKYKLKCDILKTTRGIHLYFLNDEFTKSQSVGIFNAMGIKCDIGLGNKSRVVPLRTSKNVTTTKVINGDTVNSINRITTTREWLQTYDTVDYIPPFLRPIGKKDFEFKTCETRNQTLFDYILHLQFNGYRKDEIRKIIKIINDYMLYEPLSDKEIDIITRDDAFSEDLFFADKKFLHNRFGDYMLANSHILQIDEMPCVYTMDKLYSNNPLEFEKQMISKIPSLVDSRRKEVYKYVALKSNRQGEYATPTYIGLKDSILNIETMESFEYAPKWILQNRIQYNYNPNAYSRDLDKTLNNVTCGDKQLRLLLEEMVGYTLYRGNTMQSCFILTGEGANGKSTILDVLKKLIGKTNYTSLDLRELEETFKPSEMYNKLANIGDDISAKYLESSSVFKKVVTGESFMVQRKYGQPFEMESYATQIFCANELPQVNDKTDGFIRRIVIVPFNAKFTKLDVDYDPFIKDKLLTDESIEYLLRIGIEGLQRVILNKKFTHSDTSEASKHEYNLLNNNVLEWLDTEPPIINYATNSVYMGYQIWCNDSGVHPVKKLNLSRTLKKEVNIITKVKSIDGKSTRIYAKG